MVPVQAMAPPPQRSAAAGAAAGGGGGSGGGSGGGAPVRPNAFVPLAVPDALLPEVAFALLDAGSQGLDAIAATFTAVRGHARHCGRLLRAATDEVVPRGTRVSVQAHSEVSSRQLIKRAKEIGVKIKRAVRREQQPARVMGWALSGGARARACRLPLRAQNDARAKWYINPSYAHLLPEADVDNVATPEEVAVAAAAAAALAAARAARSGDVDDADAAPPAANTGAKRRAAAAAGAPASKRSRGAAAPAAAAAGAAAPVAAAAVHVEVLDDDDEAPAAPFVPALVPTGAAGSAVASAAAAAAAGGGSSVEHA